VLRRLAPLRRKLTGTTSPASSETPFTFAYDECGNVQYVTDTVVDAWVSIISIKMGSVGRGQSTIVTHAGRGGTVFASSTNIYIAAPNYAYFPEAFGSFGPEIMPSMGMWTVVLKFAMNDGSPSFVSQAEVAGTVINQFAMDEYQGNFRIATTDGEVWSDPPTSTNAVYTFDSSMKALGGVEGLAKGERIYSVRFAGDRGYVVTFRQVDPLFVLDLSNPSKPTQLGQLKVPGFSEYLHPFDKDTIIGIGKETTESNERTTTGGVKISIFDIKNPGKPKEAAVVVVGEAGSSTPVSYEHKAFTFNPSTGLMSFPITETASGGGGGTQRRCMMDCMCGGLQRTVLLR